MAAPASSLFPGVSLIVLGIGLLGLTAGWWDLDWRWTSVLWPLLLVLIGLRLLLPRGRDSDLIVIMVAAIATLGLFLAPPAVREQLVPVRSDTETIQTVTGPAVSDATKLSLKTSAGASDFKISSLETDAAVLYRADFTGRKLLTNDTRSGDQVTSELRPQSSGGFWQGYRFDLAINPRVELSLDVSAGASQAEIDLTNLAIRQVTLEAGASSTTVTLGDREGVQNVTINAGASVLNLEVPASRGLQITTDSGLSSHNFEAAGLRRVENVYTSEGFDSAKTKTIMQLTGGASSVELIRKPTL